MLNLSAIPSRKETQQSTPLDVYALSESRYMQESIEPFLKAQEGTITQSYANTIERMYRKALLSLPAGNRAFQKVVTHFWEAHQYFSTVVEPERFDSQLIPTVESEWCLTRPATGGGRVRLVMDEDLITFFYLPAVQDPSREIMEYFEPQNLSKEDYRQLLYRFFSL